MKGKVLYIGGFKLPDKNAAAQRVLGNAKVLKALGYEVVLIGVSDNPKEGGFRSEGFSSYEVQYPKSLKEWIGHLWSTKFIEEKIISEKTDIVVMYNFPSLQMGRLRKSFNGKIKFFSDVTEWYSPSGFGPSSIVKRIDVWYRMRVLHKEMDGLIVISTFLKDYYSKFLDNIILVPPLVDLNDRKWVPNYVADIKKESEIKFVYSGSPGTGGKDKLDVIIDCFNLAKNRNKNVRTKLVIVGVTEGEYLNNFIAEQTDFSNVEFLGRVDHLVALQVISESNYAIFFRDASRVNNAGFPTKFVEAISLGVPVITNQTSDLKKYFNKYPDKLGFIVDDLNNREEIVNSINSAIIAVSDGRFDAMRSFCQNSKLFNFNYYQDEFRKLF